MNTIKLNDIFNIKDLQNVKIRFNLMIEQNWNPIELFKNGDISSMLKGHYWNYNSKNSFKKGQITIGFVKIKPNEDYWLLFHIGEITHDLNIKNGVGYKYKTLTEYEKYFGRLIVKFKNNSTQLIRNAESVIHQCEIHQLLPEIFDNDVFPGYDKVNITWDELSRVIKKENWKTALGNQKGIYLITNASNGKMYVGSAYGNDMILNRWRNYVSTYHGNNVFLKKIPITDIKENFCFSILEIFKSTTNEQIISERENWWKTVLQSRKFGYNGN